MWERTCIDLNSVEQKGSLVMENHLLWMMYRLHLFWASAAPISFARSMQSKGL